MSERMYTQADVDEIRRQEREASIEFVAYVQETASHAMCHGETYTLDEAMAALYRIHNKVDELDIKRAELTAPPTAAKGAERG